MVLLPTNTTRIRKIMSMAVPSLSIVRWVNVVDRVASDTPRRARTIHGKITTSAHLGQSALVLVDDGGHAGAVHT